MKLDIEWTCTQVFCDGSAEEREEFFQEELERQIKKLDGNLLDYEVTAREDVGSAYVQVTPTSHRWDTVNRFTIRRIDSTLRATG